ncbi:MAG: efflux RND transporter periplasmic adaptor subunit [Planctomycetes bacterium]|nr:efflux RND transporter periplasmic adaptor subunit [Planctomycetota bacterium]
MNRPLKTVRHLAIAGIVLAATASTHASGSHASTTVAPRQRPLVGVSVPSHRAAIAAEQSGTIVEMTVREGARIEQGDVLFRLSNRLQQLEVDRLQAKVDTKLDHERALANLEHADQKAERMRELLEQKISAEATASEVALESRLAKLSLGQVEFDRELLLNELLQAQARLEQRTLRSPLTGVVTRRYKQFGETADKLEPVVEVMSLDPLWIQFECPVSRRKEFEVGSMVRVTPTNDDKEPRTATVEYRSLQSAVSSHTFMVRATMPNPDYDWMAGLKIAVEPVPTPARPGGK